MQAWERLGDYPRAARVEFFVLCSPAGSETLRNCSGMLSERFSTPTIDSGPIHDTYDSLSPTRHSRPDLRLQDQARDWLGGLSPGPARNVGKDLIHCKFQRLTAHAARPDGSRRASGVLVECI